MNQDTQSCVSSQERNAAHQLRVLFTGNAKLPYSTPHIYLYNYWADLYQMYIFYALHIHYFTYKIEENLLRNSEDSYLFMTIA